MRVEGARIREVREALQLRQLDLAKRFGVTTRTVMRWEQKGAYFSTWSTWHQSGVYLDPPHGQVWKKLEEDLAKSRDRAARIQPAVSRDTPRSRKTLEGVQGAKNKKTAARIDRAALRHDFRRFASAAVRARRARRQR